MGRSVPGPSLRVPGPAAVVRSARSGGSRFFISFVRVLYLLTFFPCDSMFLESLANSLLLFLRVSYIVSSTGLWTGLYWF